jgi:hypothetical protein
MRCLQYRVPGAVFVAVVNVNIVHAHVRLQEQCILWVRVCHQYISGIMMKTFRQKSPVRFGAGSWRAEMGDFLVLAFLSYNTLNRRSVGDPTDSVYESGRHG